MNERLLVVLNKAESAQSLDLHLPEMYDARFLVNIATGERIEVEAHHVRATIGAVSWKAFVVE
jgi:SHS2 domain-containing protein